MRAADIAAALGGARRVGAWLRCRCPVHNSSGPTLALRDGKCGLVVHCHAGCARADIYAELRRCGLLPGTIDHRSAQIPTRRDARDDTARRIAAARWIWDAAQDARGTPVACYLAGRGITTPLPRSLRWAPRCPHPTGIYLPAMVATVENIDGELIGIHRTFLQSDGSRKVSLDPQKAMLGRAIGGAVRLAPIAEMLLISEGIETGLATMKATAMPAWAALSTAGLAALILPSMVRRVIILADHDVSGAGERAARTAAQRWIAEGRRVHITLPPEPGTDFADLLLGRASPQIAEGDRAA